MYVYIFFIDEMNRRRNEQKNSISRALLELKVLYNEQNAIKCNKMLTQYKVYIVSIVAMSTKAMILDSSCLINHVPMQ